jgi:hypothetical protein
MMACPNRSLGIHEGEEGSLSPKCANTWRRFPY